MGKKSRAVREKCLVTNDDGQRCDRSEVTRGLCGSHYSIARELVKKDRTTWEKLETDGRAKPRSVKSGATSFFLNGKKR